MGLRGSLDGTEEVGAAFPQPANMDFEVDLSGDKKHFNIT
jgi:hypothetical protein